MPQSVCMGSATYVIYATRSSSETTFTFENWSEAVTLFELITREDQPFTKVVMVASNGLRAEWSRG